MVNVGDEKQVRKTKKKWELEEERILEELRQLLKVPGNRYFLWRLLSHCRIFNTVSSPDPVQIALNSGRRDAGLWLLGEIENADPAAFSIMHNEATNRKIKNDG